MSGSYVAVDLHRRRSVVLGQDHHGEELLPWVRIANDPERLIAEVLAHGEAPTVAIEATYGWYWAVDALQGAGADVKLVAPAQVSAFDNGARRVKNDQRLLHRSVVININGDSYRLRAHRARNRKLTNPDQPDQHT